MKKIVALCQPFFAHQILVFGDDAQVEKSIKVSAKECADTIAALTKETNTFDVCIKGSKKYTTKIAQDVQNIAATKYNNNKINIELI